MAVTLQDIADDLGLNISTVSRVLARPDSTFGSPATRQRIREAARRLGYRPNAQARALASGKSGCVGLLVPEFQDSAFALYLQTLTDRLAEHGLLGLPLHCGRDDRDQFARLELLRSRQLDAAICLYHHPIHQRAYDALREEGFPLIFRFTQPLPEPPPGAADTREGVEVDISSGFASLITHLLNRGYQRPGVIGGSIATALAQPAPSFEHSTAAPWLLQALAQRGVAWSPQQAIPCAASTEAAHAALLQWLDQTAPQDHCDALIVQSSRLLPGVWRALMERKIAVPTTMGLASVTDTDLSRFAPVPVTVWHQPIEAICQDLVALLMRRIDNPDAAPEIRRQASFLIERASTAGPTVRQSSHASGSLARRREGAKQKKENV